MLNLPTILDPYIRRPVNKLSDIRARNIAASQLSRTPGGRFTSATLPEIFGDDFHPDSIYWKKQAEASMRYIGSILGNDEGAIWSELVFPGETIQSLTWRTIRDMAEAAISMHEHGERNTQTLAQAAHDRLAELIKENA